MSDYTRKPLARSLNVVGSNRAADAIQRQGKSLPARVDAVVSSGIVTVSFAVNASPFTLPQVTIPIVGSEYVRLPIQVGDTGMVISADARLGGVSGLGGGTPDLTQPGNLTALAFVWLGSTGWSETDDPNALVLYGPNGAVIRTTDGASKITVDAAGTVIDGEQVTINATRIDLNGDVYINGQRYTLHKHSGVQPGGGQSGGVVP
jgi:hypothetical protein